MKNSFYSFLIILAVSCNSSPDNKQSQVNIRFLKDTFDFVELSKGTIVKATFKFQNTGTADLIIKKMSLGSGCTKATPEKNTIAPGENSFINIEYNSGKDSGRVLKTVVVETNTVPTLKVFYITGTVR